MPSQPLTQQPSVAALAAIFDAQATPAIVMNAAWKICFANGAALTLLGYEPGELDGRDVQEITPTELRERYRRMRESSVSELAPRVLMRGERVVRKKSGEEIPIEIALARVVVAGVEYRVATTFDLSRQKAAEQDVIEQLYSIVEHSTAGVFVLRVGEDGSFLFEALNPVSERLTGMKSEQARGRTPAQLLPAAEAERVCEQYRRALQAGVPFTYEELGQTALGRRTFRTTLIPIRSRAGGGIERLIGLSYDLTEQKQAEDALAATRRSLSESEDRFTKAFAMCPQAIGITDLESGSIIEVNGAWERLFGYSRAEAVGSSLAALGLWKDSAQRAQLVALLREHGSMRGVEILGGDRQGRTLSLVLSGEVMEIEGRACSVVYVDDVTEHKAAQRALLDSEQLFSRAFRASPDALTILDAVSGVLIEANEGFERLFGRARADVLGRSYEALSLWVESEQRGRLTHVLRERGTLRDFPLRARRADGSERDCLVSAELIEAASGPLVLAIIRDVTDKVRVEQAKAELESQLRQAQKMDALGTLAGGIAHDFNNVLGGIVAYADLIRMDIDVPSEIESHVGELRRAVDRAADLVRQILTFSRRQPQQRRPLRADSAVREALKLLRSTLPATLQIDARLQAHTPVVLADPTQIHQIVTNLGTNAAQAMRAGGGTLTVELETVEIDEEKAKLVADLQARRYACIRVRDTGEGMRPEVVKRIFEPFFTTKPQGEGTGLGLAVVHGIVREHEGAIWVDSVPGQGTTISVYLPEHELPLSDEGEAALAPRLAQGQRVLFIDDEVVLCRSVSALLGRLGYRVTACSEPVQALELFRRAPSDFDVVLTDLTMPGLTGVDVAREILRLAPETPVLLMSGFNSGLTLEAVQAMGVVDLIAKPLGAAQLSKALSEAMLKKPTA
ncbi:MAG: PAS domain S-box protein [Polyangiaceae bacterium]